MVSLSHEALVMLFRNRPALAPELVRDGGRSRRRGRALGPAADRDRSAGLAVRLAALEAADGLEDERGMLL